MELAPGLKGEATIMVDDSSTALALGSGSVPVLATPMLVALMERAAVKALWGKLEDGLSSVGTWLECRHLAATPTGLCVTARAELVEVNDRHLIFHVEAFDTEEKVGEGKHERVIVNVNKFMARAEQKKQ